MTEKVFYRDIIQLIEKSPYMDKRELHLKRLSREHTELKKLLSSKNNTQLAKLPEIVFDMEMYRDSRQMRAVQYVMEQNVIRFWNDEILTYPV